MKNNFIYLIISLLLISTNTTAQIENVIKSYVDSTELLVNNGRKLIIQTILAKDYKKTKEIYQYLDEKTENNELKAFGYFESIYINMIIHDWDKWSQLTKNYYKYNKIKIYPNSYKILNQLFEQVVKNNDEIVFSIESSDIGDEGKSVALLLQHFIKNKTRDEKYNKMLGSFKKAYKSSKYNVFILHTLPRKSVRFAWGFSFGASALYLMDNLSKNFTPSPLYSMSFDINIGKVFSSIYVNAGVFKLNNELSVVSDGYTWDFNKGEYFQYSDVGVLLGYFLIRNNKFHVSPYVKLAGNYLESNWYDSYDDGDELFLFNSFVYGPGLHTELKLFDFKTRNFYGSRSKNYISLKLEGSYNFIHKFEFEEIKGNSAYVGMALVWGMGNF